MLEKYEVTIVRWGDPHSTRHETIDVSATSVTRARLEAIRQGKVNRVWLLGNVVWEKKEGGKSND